MDDEAGALTEEENEESEEEDEEEEKEGEDEAGLVTCPGMAAGEFSESFFHDPVASANP